LVVLGPVASPGFLFHTSFAISSFSLFSFYFLFFFISYFSIP